MEGTLPPPKASIGGGAAVPHTTCRATGMSAPILAPIADRTLIRMAGLPRSRTHPIKDMNLCSSGKAWQTASGDRIVMVKWKEERDLSYPPEGPVPTVEVHSRSSEGDTDGMA